MSVHLYFRNLPSKVLKQSMFGEISKIRIASAPTPLALSTILDWIDSKVVLIPISCLATPIMR